MRFTWWKNRVVSQGIIVSRDKAQPTLLPFDEACNRIFGLIQPLSPCHIATENADGLVLARPAVAMRTSPATALSAMDGYAVRAEDVQVGHPMRLRGHLAAGADSHAQALHLEANECARIFTGASLPNGADAILIQENTILDPDDSNVIIPSEVVSPGRFVRHPGLDFYENDPLADTGQVLTPATLALLLSAGLANITAVPKPKICLISTGDELVPVREWRPERPSMLPASNGPMLKALLARQGFDAFQEPITPDRLDALKAQIDGLRETTDFVISTGGASVGDHDIVRQYLDTHADEVLVQKIAMRPGKPVMLARLGTMWWLALPGNPVSSFVTGLIFGVGIARRLAGNQAPWPVLQQGQLGAPLPANDQRLEFMRATEANGTLTPFSQQDSSMIQNLARANALMVRPAHAPAGNIGDSVAYLPL